MSLVTLIHSANGSLVPDIPWWQIEGHRFKVIDRNALRRNGVPTSYIADEGFISKECVPQNKISKEDTKSIIVVFNGQTTKLTWIAPLAALEPIYD